MRSILPVIPVPGALRATRSAGWFAALHAAFHAAFLAAFLGAFFALHATASPLHAQDSGWRTPDPMNLLYLELERGRVVIELAPEFAPRHVANIRTMVQSGLFDGGAVVRSQDNYVAQWQTRRPGPDEASPEGVAASLPPEFEVDVPSRAIVPLPDPDAYAPQVGFVGGMPVGRDPTTGTAWIAHCYGTVGVARGADPASGNGSALYTVTGHAPRHLDRNLSMVGRVLVGMHHLSTLPRGTDALGFYETPEESAPILSAAMASSVPEPDRTAVRVMRTDSEAFQADLERRRSRTGEFFVHPVHRIGLCNALPPVRVDDRGES